jgi:hypothetical protein
MAKGKGIPPEETIKAAPKPELHQYTQQEFVDGYNALCKKTGWMITAQAGLRPMNDLGGSLIVTQLVIVPWVESK